MSGGKAYNQVRELLFLKHLKGDIKFCSFIKASNALYKHRKKDTRASFNDLWMTVNQVLAGF